MRLLLTEKWCNVIVFSLYSVSKVQHRPKCFRSWQDDQVGWSGAVPCLSQKCLPHGQGKLAKILGTRKIKNQRYHGVPRTQGMISWSSKLNKHGLPGWIRWNFGCLVWALLDGWSNEGKWRDQCEHSIPGHKHCSLSSCWGKGFWSRSGVHKCFGFLRTWFRHR